MFVRQGLGSVHCACVLTNTCRKASQIRPRVVLGIETSCDETGAAVVDETGEIRGESLHSQKQVHVK